MPINNIDFYYFSGTGNTLLIVKNMKEVFETEQATNLILEEMVEGVNTKRVKSVVFKVDGY